mgnify:CR=1 FL=1
MLYEEAKWIGEKLLNLSKPGDKVLNIGSSTHHVRKVSQPHMDNYIFKPLVENNRTIVHTDIIDEKGVDIVGDLTNRTFVDGLRNQKYNFVLCSNLLEHLENKALVVNAIEDILPAGGKALITVPYNYPFHLDPIDTMFRPKTHELKKLFQKLNFCNGEIVKGRSYRKNKFQKNYFQQLITQPELFLRLSLRLLIPFYKFTIWKSTFISYIYMFKHFSVTCIILEKTKHDTSNS